MRNDERATAAGDTTAMRNIFVVGADAFNLDQVRSLPGAENYRLHTLCSYEEAKGGDEYPVEHMLHEARRTLDAFPGSVDAIICWWDFPVSTMLPILQREYDLAGPTLESLLKCEHKYWSRIEQQRCVADHVPRFDAVDPFAADAVEKLSLPFPFWIKPVKSAASFLGFKVRNEQELHEVLEKIRGGIDILARPFNHILEHAQLPPEIAAVDGRHCIAEAIISRGRQCTLEGFVYRGTTEIYGVIDSRREGKYRSSFSRYQYPSTIPRRICERMIGITRRFIDAVGYDNAPFNIEFYWDEKPDRLWLLEINTRISKSHTPLFQMVDGRYHHQVMLDLALGRPPVMPHREGRYRVAAKFMLRHYSDAVVERVPTQDEIEQVRERYPQAEFLLHIHEGERLSDLKGQDSYSYETGVLFLGAGCQRELLAAYEDAMQTLQFRFADLPA